MIVVVLHMTWEILQTLLTWEQTGEKTVLCSVGLMFSGATGPVDPEPDHKCPMNITSGYMALTILFFFQYDCSF